MSKFKLTSVCGGKKIMKNKIAIFTLSLLGLYQPAQAITLIGWDIPTSATVPAPTASTAIAGMSVATGVTTGNFTMGTGLTAGSTTGGWRVGGYNQMGTDTAALTAANTAGDYWAFQFGASSGYSVVVNGIGSGQWTTSSTGPAKMSMIYSTSSDFASYSTIATATATAGTTFNFASSFTTALLNAPITIAEGVTGFFRLVGYGGTSTTGGGTGGLVGTLTAPDFSILGTTTSLALLNWTGGTGEWANGVAANWQNAVGTSTAWAAGKDGTIGNGGTLAVNAGGVTAGVVTVSGATAATFTGGAVSAGSLAMTAGSTLNLNNANSAVSGGIDLTDATLSGGNLAVGSAAVNVSTGTKTISTSLSGATATLTKSGAGELILSGANTYSGQTAVTAGTLTTTGANMLSDTAALKVDNLATFKLGGNETVGNINAASGSAINLQSYTLTSGGNNISSTNTALTTGTGGLVKNGTGLMYFSSAAANSTYSGGFTLNEGEVQFTSSGNGGSGGVTNSVFGTGTLTLNGGTISSSSANSGRNILNNIVLNGTVQSGQTAWGTTNVRLNPTTITNTNAGVVTTNITGYKPTLTVSTNAGSATTMTMDSTINTIGATEWGQAISGNYRLTKTGTGDVSLSNNYLNLKNSNNIAGVTVSSGTLGYANRYALGTGTLILADGVVVGQSEGINNIATENKDADRTVANNISLLGNATFGLGGNANFFSGNVDLNNAARTLTMQNTTTFFGEITNGGLLVQRLDTDLTSSKVLFLSGSNSYAGGTTVNGVAGRTNNITLGLGNNNALGTGSLTFAGGGTNYIRGTTLSTGDLNRTITNNIAINSGVTVSVDAMTNLVTFNTGTPVTNAVSVNMALNGVISGDGALVKTNSNTLTLGGANTYAGTTTVDGGTLAVNGSLSSAGSVVVNANGLLGGSGSVGAITGAGTVGPGNSPGILTATSVNPTAGTDFKFEFTALNPTYTSATASGNDLLHLTAASPFAGGTFASGNIISIYLNNATITASLLAGTNTTFSGGFFVDGTYALASALTPASFAYYTTSAALGTGSAVDYNGTSYFLMAGFAEKTTLSDTAVTSAGFATGTVSGTLLTFNVLPVPEPSTGALLAFGLGGLVVTRLLRRKQS